MFAICCSRRCAPGAAAGVAALALALSVAARAQSPRYTVVDLHQAGAYRSEAWSINRAGLVVGDVQPLAGGPHLAFGWAQGVRLDFPTPEGVQSMQGHGAGDGDRALLTGRLTQIVGRTNLPRSYLADGGELLELVPLPGDNGSQAVSINKAGIAVGVSVLFEGNATSPATTTTQAAIWHDETPLPVGAGLPEARASVARDINDRNAILGATVDPQNRTRPWIQNDQGRIWLEAPADAVIYVPVAMNNFLAVAGLSYGSDFAPRAVADLGAGPFLLDGLGGVISAAYDINDQGQIVGVAQRADYTFRGFLWEDGRTADLSTLVDDSDWIVTTANGVNDDGWIVGAGYRLSDPEATVRALLLKPIDPEFRDRLCPSDFSRDGMTGSQDLLAVLAGFGVTHSADDLLLVLQNWGAPCEIIEEEAGVFAQE